MITVATVFYEGGLDVPPWARCYAPAWVDKLYRGVARNYSQPFKFVCLTDRQYDFKEDVEQQPLRKVGWRRAMLQTHAVKADRLFIMGLDTIIVGNLDDILGYEGPLAVPRDPYHPQWPCNGVVLGPMRDDIAAVDGTDMVALREFKYDWLDDLFPGQILSYKVHVRGHALPPVARIVYFHGEPKPNEVDEAWVKEHWQ